MKKGFSFRLIKLSLKEKTYLERLFNVIQQSKAIALSKLEILKNVKTEKELWTATGFIKLVQRFEYRTLEDCEILKLLKSPESTLVNYGPSNLLELKGTIHRQASCVSCVHPDLLIYIVIGFITRLEHFMSIFLLVI